MDIKGEYFHKRLYKVGDTIWKLKDLSQKTIFVRKITLDDADKGQSEVLNDFIEFKEGTKAKDIDKKS